MLVSKLSNSGAHLTRRVAGGGGSGRVVGWRTWSLSHPITWWLHPEVVLCNPGPISPWGPYDIGLRGDACSGRVGPPGTFSGSFDGWRSPAASAEAGNAILSSRTRPGPGRSVMGGHHLPASAEIGNTTLFPRTHRGSHVDVRTQAHDIVIVALSGLSYFL